jgi:hypothetical protein
MMMIDKCGTVGGIKIDRGERTTWRKLAPVPFFPPESHMIWERNWATEVRSQRLTA